MVSQGYLISAAHLAHIQNNPQNPAHQRLEAIRAPDIGAPAAYLAFVAEDVARDIALYRIDQPGSSKALKLLKNRVAIGTPCGSLGFPLSSVEFRPEGRMLHLVERFQSASISAYHTEPFGPDRELAFYETDALMYKGSSGCPGFLRNGKCFGMHVRSVIETPRQGGTGPLLGGETRLAISLWVPSFDIIEFLRANDVPA